MDVDDMLGSIMYTFGPKSGLVCAAAWRPMKSDAPSNRTAKSIGESDRRAVLWSRVWRYGAWESGESVRKLRIRRVELWWAMVFDTPLAGKLRDVPGRKAV